MRHVTSFDPGNRTDNGGLGFIGRISALATLLVTSSLSALLACASPAHAATESAKHRPPQHSSFRRAGHGSLASRGIGGGMQCVTFARAETGIELSGNAANWWDNAAGVYDRGNTPEPGAILNFRANGRMRLGHVSVVRSVVSSREILIDHANWSSRGGISRSVSVVDVSADNDWTAVRVRLGGTENYGAVYPTYGFIYTRSPGSQPEIRTASAEPIPELNAAPADLRNSPVRSYAHGSVHRHVYQVAMAPSPKHIKLSLPKHSFAERIAHHKAEPAKTEQASN